MLLNIIQVIMVLNFLNYLQKIQIGQIDFLFQLSKENHKNNIEPKKCIYIENA